MDQAQRYGALYSTDNDAAHYEMPDGSVIIFHQEQKISVFGSK